MRTFLDEVHGRIDELTSERERLSLEITERQGRYALVTTELTHLEALVAMHEGGASTEPRAPFVRDVELRLGVGERSVRDGGPKSAVLREPAASTTEPPASPRNAVVSVATPPDGAWKAEAIRLLEEHGQPMHYRDLYRALAARGFVFGGRNPEGVLLTGVSREKNVFFGVGKGGYWLVGRESKAMQPAAGPSTPRKASTRPRPIGRARRKRA
jgi:hypothetical protein